MEYNKIGIPNLGNGFKKTNPFEQMNKIVPKRFTTPGNSSIDKASNIVRKAVKTRTDRENQEARYRQFIENQKAESKKIAEKRKRDYEELDKKRAEEYKRNAEQNDKEYEQEFTNWVNELAEHGDGYKGVLARNLVKMGDNKEGAFNSWRHILKGMYNFNNMIGSLVGDATSNHLESIASQKNFNDLTKSQADAHIQRLNIQKNIDIIENQKDLLAETVSQPNSKNDPGFRQRYNEVKKQISEYNNQINLLKQKMNNPQLKELDEEYKIDYVLNHGGLGGYIAGELWDSVKLLNHLGTYNKLKKSAEYRAARRAELLREYDEKIANNNQTEGNKGSYMSLPQFGIQVYNSPKNKNEEPKSIQQKLDKDLKVTEHLKQQMDAENKELQNDYLETSKLNDQYNDYWRVSEAYKKGKQIHQDASLFSPDYWFYVAPGMIGSSNSSMDQIKSNLIQYGSLAAGAAVSMLGSPVAGAAVTNIGGALAIPGQIKGGFDENYAETGQKKVDNLYESIKELSFFNDDPKSKSDILGDLKKQSIQYYTKHGYSKDWINERYNSGTEEDDKNALRDLVMGLTKNNDPRLQEAMLNSNKGLKAQFWADNVRTMGEMPIQLAMNFLPTKPLAKAGDVVLDGGKVLSKKLVNKVAKTKAGKIISKVSGEAASNAAEQTAERYANGFRRPTSTFKSRMSSGYDTGSAIGESLGFGYGGRIAFGAAGAAAREVAHYGSKLLTPQAKAFVRRYGDQIMNKYQNIYDKLLPKDWMRIGARYGLNAARRGFMQATSEGAEEGVQYLNSKEDFASKYGFGNASLGDLIINDFVQGGRVAEAYLSLMGIGNSKLDDDLEFWQNVKGGFALGGMGGFHPGQLINFYGNVKNAVRQYKTDQFIRQSAVMNRERNRLDRAANVAFAEQAMNGRGAEVIESMQTMYQNDRRRENPIYTQDDYDEKIDAANKIISLTKNEKLKQQLKAKGIEYGTKEYATAIADIYDLQSQQEQNEKQRFENDANLRSAYQNNELNNDIDNIVTAARAGDLSLDLALSQKRIQAGNKAVKDAIEQAKKDGKDTKDPEFNLSLEKIRNEAQDKAEEEGLMNYKEYVREKTRLVNRLKALLKFKGQQNSAQDFFNFLSDKLKLKTKRPDAKTILNSTIAQIEETKRALKQLDPDINFGKTDADLLDVLEAINDVSTVNQDDIQQLELNSVALAADRAVTQSYINQFQYGLVKNGDKYEYNPTQYKKGMDRDRRYIAALMSGDTDKAESIRNEDITTPYNPEDVKNNEYKTRVNKIREADRENAKLNWMASDAFEGDIINKYMESLQEEAERKNAKTESIKPDDHIPFDPSDSTTTVESKPASETKWDSTREKRNSNLAKAKEKYERRKAKAKEVYEKNKKKLRRNTYGSFIPALPQLAQAANYLLQQAKTSTYKIAQFVEELKEIAEDIDIDSVLPAIKELYSKYAAKQAIFNSDILNNLSSPEEIASYGYTAPHQIEPAAQLYNTIQNTINKDNQNIIKDISTYFNTIVQTEDGSVVVCKNQQDKLYFTDETISFYKEQAKKLKQLNTSDESFENALKQIAPEGFPIQTYVKYRNTEGIEQAIIVHIYNYKPSPGIIAGELVRSAAIGILVGDNSAVRNIAGFSGYEEFIADMTSLKKSFDDLGYQIINTNQMLYDTNTRNSVQADIIVIDKNKDIHVIDILSSYIDIKSRWDYKPGRKANYTIHQREENILHQIEDILLSKFGQVTKSLSVLPVTCDIENLPTIFVQKTDGKINYMHIPTKLGHENKVDLAKEHEKAVEQISRINEQIKIYNSIVDSINNNRFNKLNELTVSQQYTAEQYNTYFKELSNKYDDVIGKISEINDFIEKSKNKEYFDVSFEELFKNQDLIPQEVEDKINYLSDICNELDCTLTNIPGLKATTQEEKDNVKKLYQCVFDAQKALDMVLKDPNTNVVDVTREQELIASAMEKLAENTVNFGEMSKFVQKWWLEDFVIDNTDTGDNTSRTVKGIGEKYFQLHNTIKNWTKTLHEHVLNDLHNRPVLQEWYDTLLNNYFAKLIDNAQKFNTTYIQDVTQKQILENDIQDGLDLIRDFNEQFSMREDKEYPEAPKDAAEKLNRISQKWTDLYATSTQHNPAWDAMLYNDAYYNMSQKPDFLEKVKVSFYVANKPKTYRNSRGYGYNINEGDVVMYIEYTDDNGKKNWADLPILISPGYQPTSNEETQERIRKINNVHRKFAKIVKQALKIVAEDKNKKISFTLSTNKGSIKYDNITSTHLVTDFLFKGFGNEQDLYTIKTSKENRIGLSVFTMNKNTGTMFYDVYAGSDLRTRIGGFDDTFQKQHLAINNGAVIYFYSTGNNQYIGVPIETGAIGEESAKRLVYLMQLYMRGDRNINGYDIYSLLQQRLYMADLSNQKKLSVYNNTNNRVVLNNTGIVEIGSKKYDISTQINDLIKDVSGMSNNVDAKLLNENMSDSQNSVFYTAKQMFKNTDADKIELPNGYVFYREDFTHKNADGTQGSTWLGYMLRNGVLRTRAIGKSYTQLNVDNFGIVDKNQEIGIEKKDVVKSVEKQHERLRNRNFRNLGGLTYSTQNVNEIMPGTSEEFRQKIVEYFDKVFGNHDTVYFADEHQKFLGQIGDNQYVLGLCCDQMIKLSQYAPRSVAYHEAFHKIMELVLPDNVREEFYDSYRKRNGKNISDRKIAEAFADMYMDYMTNKDAIKQAKWYKKPFKWFKQLTLELGLVPRIGVIGAVNMINTFHNTNKGKYANIEISEQKKKRFRKLFGEGLYYTVNNKSGKSADFKYLANSGDVQEMVRALGYWIASSMNLDSINAGEYKIKDATSFVNNLSQDLIDELCGNHLDDSEIDNIHRAFKEVFQSENKSILDKKGKVVGFTKVYPKLDVLLDKINEYIESTITAYSGKIEDVVSDENIDDDTEKAMSKNIDQYDKSSYETSKLDTLPESVKFFLSTIPYVRYNNDEDGNKILDYDLSKNKFLSPTFMPMTEVFNTLVNDLHFCSSLQDLDKELKRLSETKEMYKYIYNKFHNLYEQCYKHNQDGSVKINYNAESYCASILCALRGLKIDFITSISRKQENGKEIKVGSSSLDRDRRMYSKQWTQFLISGQVSVFKRERDKNGHLIFNEGMGGAENKDIFSRTAGFIEKLREGLTSANQTFELDGIEYNKSIFDDIEDIKRSFIDKLNTIGIIFSKDALNSMLSNKYNGTGVDALERLLTDKGEASISTFIDRLYNFVDVKGNINEDVLNKAYTDNGFVKELGNQQGIYNRNTIEAMALGLNGKKLHAVSQNNSISHIVNALNTNDKNNPIVRTLMKFGYNITNTSGFDSGSIILKNINNGKCNISTHIYVGSKTDNKGDGGTEYKQEPIVDDYMAKIAMTQQGYLVFPTLADKGTWMCLSGIELPGMVYNESGDVTNVPTFMWYGTTPYIRPSNQVLDQMLEYAKGERLAIQQCMEDLGYDNIPGYEKQGRKVLPKEAYIKNYHTKNGSVEPNGTRFLSLTEIVQLDKETGEPMLDKDGNLKTINLNNPIKSSKDMLKLANEWLFEKREGETDEQFLERQRKTMAYTLNIQYQLEVQNAIDLGLVTRRNINEYNLQTKQDKILISEESQSFSNLDTHMFNQNQIEHITNKIMESIPAWNNLPNGPKKQARLNVCKGLAIASILSDATTKSIIASQEVQRCFSGHPAMFKVTYEGDHIKDSTFDIQKRIGGMVSTGDDNIENLPNMKSSYRCAECKDYEVKSSSDIFNRLESMFTDNAIRDMYAIIKDNYVDAYNMTIDEILSDESLSEQDKDALTKAKEKGRQFFNAYTGDINVADGAAYITDQMCENLLRLRGALTGRVKKAFDILRSKDKYNWMDKSEAYKDIYEAVNIVSTKYTAYGFRNHTLNGEDQSDVAVSYYNKFALFPLFPCIATGHMSGIYDKMLNEKVDMLFMTSAVKVGSQGAVKYDGTTINEPFNVYEQDYGFLRRQQNTDPEEGETTAIGTQMVKVVLQNLRLDRVNYIDNATGYITSGEVILYSLMNSINKLTELGYKGVKEEFGIDEFGNVDNKKLSRYLISQMSSRNANKGLIEALQVDEKGNFKAPIAATSDSSWIESILISSLNKRIIDIITPGNSFVQRSVFAIEGSSTQGGAIQSDATMSPTINGGKKLQMINEDHSMDAVISIDYFENILPKGLSFNEARQWLIDNNIIGSGAKANTIGYRIPTQAQSSIHALRFVDVIPAVKSTIILPEEFTKITGSDFDIDHLYLASFNYKKSEDGKTVSHDQFDPNSAEYHQNNILNQMMTLLKDTENSIHSLYKSIDNDTELLTDIAEQIPEQGSNKSRAYNFGSLHEQVIRRNDYITGKFGIGPYALNVTNQELTRCFRVSFKKTRFTEKSGICNFDKLVDDQYNYIASWISAFINAHVDIVKDPYISKMNINQFTYNMSNLLIRSGFGESALWFLSQPIIRDMANASNSANSEFMRNPNKFKTVYSAQKEAVANAVLKWLSPEDVSELIISKYITGDKNNTAEQLRVVNAIKSKMNVLKAIATHPGQKTVTVDGYIYDVTDIQRDVFYAWKTLERYSIALGNLVQKTKIDTKKQGKSFLAIYKYKEDFNRLFYGDSEKSLWDEDSLHRLAEESWIKSKTDYACSLPFVILKRQTFNGNNVFIHEITELYNQLNPEQESINVKKLEAISKAVQTQIKCKYIAKYAKEYLGKTDKQISELFVGKYSIAHRLNMLNTAIRTMDQYKRLADNMLIQQIYSAQEQEPVLVNGKRYERPSFIAIADRVGDNSMNSDMLIDAWQDLLLDEDKVVRQFARDLIVYAYMTSGEYAGWNNLFKYVPPAWIRGEIDTAYGESMASYVQNILSKNDFEKYIDLDELARNNFQDYTFSRRLAEKNADGERNILYNTDQALIIRTANDVKPPLYITTRVPGSRGNNASNFNIYKLVTPIGGVGEKNESTASMYIKIKKAGFDSGHKQKIYEYGWDFKYVENYSKNLSTIDTETMTNRLFGFISEHKNALPNQMYQEIIQSINDSKYDQQNDVVTPTVPITKKESKLGYNSMSDIVMHSGGAYGADTAWDFYARNAGVKQINHYRDQGNQVLSSSLNKRGVKATVLSKEQMEYARRRERELLGKYYDNTLQGNLQVRNFYQVASSDGVFAIASMNSVKNGVSGGTNTAVQLGISLNKPTHVFDLNSEKWYKYNPESKMFEEESTPVLTKNFAGVGTRDIQKYNVYKDGKWVEREQYVGDDKSKVALKAIEDVFNKTQAELSNVETSTDQKENEELRKSSINQNDTDQFGTTSEQASTLNSNKTILTNAEILALHPFTGNDTKPRIAVASEHTDPVFFSKMIQSWANGEHTFLDYKQQPIKYEDIDALYLITKHDGLPMRELLQINKPKIIHFSVTTLGNTKWEPGVMKWQDMIERIGDFIKQGLDPEYVTLRIDPIIPGVTKISEVDKLMKRASELGIKHVRFSVLDYYKTTAKFMEQLGYNYSKYFDKNKSGVYFTHAKSEIIKRIAEKMLAIAKKYNLDLSSCAEPCRIDGISIEGCLSVNAINSMLGTHIPNLGTENNKFRQFCTCYGGKTDLLRYNNNCASSCVYCYAHHNGDKMLNYYNEDGTLKQNRFTDSGLIESTSNKMPKNYQKYIDIIQKYFDIGYTTGRIGKNASKQVIQKLHIHVNENSDLFNAMKKNNLSEKDLLNALYILANYLNKPEIKGRTNLSSQKIDELLDTMGDDILTDILGTNEGFYDIKPSINDSLIVNTQLISDLDFLFQNRKYIPIYQQILDYVINDEDTYNDIIDIFTVDSVDLSDLIQVDSTFDNVNQLELFSEEDMKKAQEIKNYCKGGK